LLEPAIRLAENGFGVARFGVEEITGHAPELAAHPDHGAAFCDNYPFANGVKTGNIIRQPQLADTLRQIGSEGPSAFYEGALGQRIIAHLQEIGGTLTMADLAEVTPVWREPICVPYRGLLVHTPPPPCEGFQFLLTLRILEAFDLASHGLNTAGHLDLIIRAIRLAASVRIENNFPTPEKLTEILSESFVDTLRGRLRAGGGFHGPTEQWTHEAPGHEDPGHTTSFSIADRDGNVVCITQSLGSVFGSGIVVPHTGVCLSNFMYWADVQTGSPNRTAPGRPLPMCMAPSISCRNGVPELALGTPGSYGILQTQVQALINHIDFGLPLQDAIEAPRGRVWEGSTTEFESRIDPAVIGALQALGHDARMFASAWTKKVGGMQAIRRDSASGLLTGAADPRRDGYAIAL
jgi:gamma-glutamyltranspeptidase/glutathione hydrolase